MLFLHIISFIKCQWVYHIRVLKVVYFKAVLIITVLSKLQGFFHQINEASKILLNYVVSDIVTVICLLSLGYIYFSHG